MRPGITQLRPDRAPTGPASARLLRAWGVALAAAAAVSACGDPIRPTPPEIGQDVVVDSDPTGAAVVLDGDDTGLTTPATLSGLTSESHEVQMSIDSNGVRYSVNATFVPSTDSVISFIAPLGFRCFIAPCGATEHTAGDIRFRTMPNGALVFAGFADEMFWPAATSNGYAATGAALFAAVDSNGDTVALGPYDSGILYGRPAREIVESPFRLRQSAWVLPPSTVTGVASARGMRVDQEVIGGPEAPDGLLLRLTFTNVTDRTSYVLADPAAAGGITFNDAYVGFALDGDVGVSEDDLVGYDADPARLTAYVYDSDFSESSFSADWRARPGLVGLRVAEAPAGAAVRMNAWPRALDWKASALRLLEPSGPLFEEEATGYPWVSASGARDTIPNAAIGVQPTAPADYRIVVSAGPVALAPGQSATVSILLALAEPSPGTFTSGVVTPPGDPTDETRPLFSVAQALRDSFLQAEALLSR